MNQKQNIIFFLGVILIIMVFWVNGYWKVLKAGVGGPVSSKSQGGTVIKPGGKCPPGWSKIGNICLPPGNTIGPGNTFGM